MKSYYRLLLTLLVVSNFATAQDLQYNLWDSLRKEQVDRAFINARYCMYSNVRIFLARGMKDETEITNNLIRICGRGVKATYANFYGNEVTEEGVDDLIETIAYVELHNVIGVPEYKSPPVKKSTSNKLIVVKPVEPKLYKFKDGHSEYIVTDPKTGQVRRWEAPN